jgi:uncharacterized protein (TIGR02677 family)
MSPAGGAQPREASLDEFRSPVIAPLAIAAPQAGRPAVEREAEVVLPTGRLTAFAYLDTPATYRYRQIMTVLVANKRAFGLRLGPAEVAERLRARFASGPASLDDLERDLGALCEWGAADAHQDTSKATSTREFKRRRFTYDVTVAGEIAERAAQQVDRITERVGALERSQLPELLAALATLAEEVERPAPRPPKLVAALNDIAAKLERLVGDTSDFIRDLGAVMADEEAIEPEPFALYKTRVVDHLQGFRSELVRLDAEFASAVERVERAGADRMLELAASSDDPPVYGLSDEEVAARRAARLGEEWEGVRRWFRGRAGEPPPWRELDRTVGDAIEWILQAAQRLIDRRSRRVDRSAEYRQLARLFADAPAVEDCHALYAGVFALFAPRHFAVPEEDPELTPPSASWWDGRPAPVEASLRRPGARAPGPGRVPALADHAMARAALVERRARERAELQRARRRFAGFGPLRLGALARLDALEFAHLLGWLGRALEASTGEDGVRRAESQDGLVRLALHAPAAPGRLVELVTPLGTFAAPDYAVEIEAA